MFSSILTAAMIGTALVSALPAPQSSQQTTSSTIQSTTTQTTAQSSQQTAAQTTRPSYQTSTTTTQSAAYGAQTPFKFPLVNGFPNIEIPSGALTAIEKEAHGTLPDTQLANQLAAQDITSFEAIAFNELFEVAFFSSLVHNVTNNAPGFEIESAAVKAFVLESLKAIRAQEELHALGANAILTAAGSTAIEPCEYIFPSADFDSAINFARTFTDVVLGTLQDVQAALAANGDAEYIPLIAAVIGQEGEQNGWYRSLLGLNPSELPFLTASTGPWAFSALNQKVIVPGSCPNSNIIKLPVFGALNVLTQNITGENQNLQFSFTTNGTAVNNFSVVYTNQQNQPIVEQPTNIQVDGNTVTFDAFFPFDQYIMNGLTIVAVTSNAGPFPIPNDVAAATLFGPGLIEIS